MWDGNCEGLVLASKRGNVAESKITDSDNDLPGLDRAFEFVLPSYQWALQRFEAIDARLQGVLTFAVTITLAGPVVGKLLVPNITGDSIWLAVALVTFGLAIVLGSAARVLGSVRLMSPTTLFNEWLEESEREFDENAVYWAGQHLDRNVKIIGRKALSATVVTVLVAIEGLGFVKWILDAL